MNVPALVLALVLPGQAATDDKGLAEAVRRHIPLLASDDLDTREAALAALVRLGHAAIHHLEPYTRSKDVEVRSRAGVAIERIYTTDPLFFIRPAKPRVSVRLKGALPAQAYEEVFKHYREPARLRNSTLSALDFHNRRVTLTLEDARYWKAVEEFRAATGTYLKFDVLGGTDFVADRPRGQAFSRPHGRFRIGARARRDEGSVELNLRLFVEPGWMLIDSGIHLNSIEAGDGRAVLKDFKQVTGEYLGIATVEGNGPVLPRGDVRLRIRGRAWARLPSDFNAIVLRPDEFTKPQEHLLGPARIHVKSVSREGDHRIKIQMEVAQAEDVESTQWHFIADDEGHWKHNMRLGFRGNAKGITVGRGLKDYRPTRICIIQPSGEERVEFPFEIGPLSLEGEE